jgi:hypothetical protein
MVPKATIFFISAWATDCDSPDQTLQWKEKEKEKEKEELQEQTRGQLTSTRTQ